jgi:hypothetical protein
LSMRNAFVAQYQQTILAAGCGTGHKAAADVMPRNATTLEDEAVCRT